MDLDEPHYTVHLPSEEFNDSEVTLLESHNRVQFVIEPSISDEMLNEIVYHLYDGISVEEVQEVVDNTLERIIARQLGINPPPRVVLAKTDLLTHRKVIIKRSNPRKRARSTLVRGKDYTVIITPLIHGISLNIPYDIIPENQAKIEEYINEIILKYRSKRGRYQLYKNC